MRRIVFLLILFYSTQPFSQIYCTSNYHLDSNGGYIIEDSPNKVLPNPLVNEIHNPAGLLLVRTTAMFGASRPGDIAGVITYDVEFERVLCDVYGIDRVLIDGEWFPTSCSYKTWPKAVEERAVACAEVPMDKLRLFPDPSSQPPRPLGAEGNGKSTFKMILRLTDRNNLPKSNVKINFLVVAQKNSGGHDHHSALRPTGDVSPLTFKTDINGEIKPTFVSSEFAGTHEVTAICEDCTPKYLKTGMLIDVKIPDLVELPAGSGYILQGNTSDIGKRHLGNHYFTKEAVSNLIHFKKTVAKFGWQPLYIDDASLMWGGRFDIRAGWGANAKESHQEHRTGEEVDIGLANGTDPQKTRSSYDEFCKSNNIGIPTTILWHDIPPKQGGLYPLHFHLRLSGLYASGNNAGKPAPCKRDSVKK